MDSQPNVSNWSTQVCLKSGPGMGKNFHKVFKTHEPLTISFTTLWLIIYELKFTLQMPYVQFQKFWKSILICNSFKVNCYLCHTSCVAKLNRNCRLRLPIMIDLIPSHRESPSFSILFDNKGLYRSHIVRGRHEYVPTSRNIFFRQGCGTTLGVHSWAISRTL